MTGLFSLPLKRVQAGAEVDCAHSPPTDPTDFA